MRTEVSWKVDKAGMVIGARTHDGNLSALSYSDGGALRLDVATVTGERVEIELTEVGQVGIVGFRKGAIFGEAFVWKLGDLDPQNLDWMHSQVLALFGNDLDVTTARDELAKIIQAGSHLLLVYVGFSYGGEIAAICNRLRVYQTPAAANEETG